jgi:PAS domain S-box-containing protein
MTPLQDGMEVRKKYMTGLGEYLSALTHSLKCEIVTGAWKMNYNGQEVFFDRNDLIVSKTDLKGHIIYANHTFLEIAGYDEEEVLGKPHNIIRHPNMPRGVFDLFWEQIANEKEIFAYVVNAAKNGDHYWVIAHVTPSYHNGAVVGYHSTRRVPNSQIIRDVIEPLYDNLNRIERSTSNRKEAINASQAALNEAVSKQAEDYDAFVSSLMQVA